MSCHTSLVDLDRRVLWHPFTQMAEWEPLVIARGEGNYLIDSDGRRYLDGVSSLWCNVHGHHHPRLDRALREQLDKRRALDVSRARPTSRGFDSRPRCSRSRRAG